MKVISPGFISAPFNMEQIRSINRFQKSGVFSPLQCSCGGLYYAREDGLMCEKCFHLLEEAPKLTTNFAWDKFKLTEEEKKNGINQHSTTIW